MSPNINYKRLKRLLAMKGVTQCELARRVGVHPSRITHVIRGYAAPTAAQRQRIAEALEVDPTWLWGKERDAAA